MKISAKKAIMLVILFLVFQVVLFLVTGPLLIYLYLFSESHFEPMPEIDTIFAPNFSKAKFETISVGMNQEEVAELLGTPIGLDYGRKLVGVDTDSADSSWIRSDAAYCWHYSKDGKLGKKADFSWYLYRVCFDNDMVYTTHVQELFD